ncbi:MAG: hypothetical protein A2341_26695 [Deltaproteobacteria bacterium RIFOXYB12_FULL_58_9]|nr:MAG: hypothetical protein A2341_26695 [Deltaproteobacteria bacterium RIFOXYB12_FULL_58_9]
MQAHETQTNHASHNPVVALGASPVRAQSEMPQPVVRAIMFWMAGCPYCEDVIQNVLPPLRVKYDAQFDLLMLEVVDTQDVDMLYRAAALYNIPKEQTGVPFIIIGDRVLIGSAEVREQLPALIDDYLTRGGMDWPATPVIATLLPTASPASFLTSDPSAISTESAPTESDSVAPHDNGFTLAIAVMIVIASSLLYSVVSFAIGKTFDLPDWADWLIPALIVIGIGVASYLSYVETQSVTAFCGPIGDCNIVQQSRYARLFDVLPVGMLGLLGYLALLAAWLGRKFICNLEKLAAIGFWGMALFAVIFSLYLTYLEPFVIKAVCIWCLASSVIATLLLLLGTPPAISHFALSDNDE